MTDLVRFLRDRIKEDAALAQDTYPFRWIDDGYDCRDITAADAPHIARWSPARVLADCEIRLDLVDMHDGDHECPSADDNCGWWQPGLPVPPFGDEPWTIAPDCPTMRLLALPYADHPDFDESWRS